MVTDSDSIKFWLDSAGRWPLLGPDEIIRLTRLIQSNPEDSKIHQNAIKKIVRHNLRLVPTVAQRIMQNKYGKEYGCNYTIDVFQNGAIGLIKAAKKFDPTLGYAFSTYAYYWIYQSIQRDLYRNMSLIRVPENTIREYYNFVEKINNGASILDFEAKILSRCTSTAAALGCKSADSFFAVDSDEEGLTYSFKSEENIEVFDSIEDIVAVSSCCEFAKALVLEHYRDNIPLDVLAEKYVMPSDQVFSLVSECLSDLKSKISVV